MLTAENSTQKVYFCFAGALPLMSTTMPTPLPGRPAFLTLAMWLAWIVRPEVRRGAALHDPVAQRDYVAWWLLHGRDEYPAVWWWGAPQAGVAMEPVTAASGVPLPRLLHVLWALWPALRDRFDTECAESCAEYLAWYRLVGPTCLAVAPRLPPACMILTEQPTRREGWMTDGHAPPRVVVAAAAAPDGRPPVLDLGQRRRLIAWFAANRDHAIPPPTLPPDTPEPLPRAVPHTGLDPRGVNLVGFARAEMGIGEDVRAMSGALDAAGVRHCVIDILPQSGARLGDGSLRARVAASPRYATTVFCMTAIDAARVYLQDGPALFAAAVRVGAWAWELPSFPDDLVATYDLVDEIWAHTAYMAASYRANAPIPVRLMPASVALPPALALTAAGRPVRRRFTAVYQFDPNSYFARKNPLGAIAAFRRAFPAEDRAARLLLRVNGILDEWQEAAALRAACAADPRISIHEGTLSRRAMLRLLAGADVFISPHRAEGFGRNLAEALLLGLPVLATGFSGNTDFLLPTEQVRWRARGVGEGDYPFGDGQWWAEPDTDDLATRLAVLAEAVRAGRGPSLAWRRRRAAAFDRVHGPRAAGLRYRAALAELRQPAVALTQARRVTETAAQPMP